MDKDPLYVIVPYFNFINYKSGLENLQIFINNISLYKQAKVVIVEGYHNINEQLPDMSDNVFKHIKLPVNDIMWIKENLINIGFSQLPTDWKYGAWIDRDIIFCNPNWVQDSIEKLQTCDMIQPWEECLFLNKHYQHEHIDFGEWKIGDTFKAYSFCSIENAKRNKQPIDFKKFSHPGQAWCITREFYEKMGGLYEYCILGSGDGIMMFSLMGKTDHEMLTRLGKTAFDFFNKVQGCRLGHITGLIIHNYHGTLSKRKYVSKHKIYEQYQYDPISFTAHDEFGVLQLTALGKSMEQNIKNYLVSRDEDSE